MIATRNATQEDLDAIMQVEQSWPEDARAEREVLAARLEKFPQGFFIAHAEDEGGEMAAAATITCMPLHFDADSMRDKFSSWDEVTNNGYIGDFDLAECNALYIVSGVIDQRFRGINIFTPMVLRVVELAASLGLRYVLAGAVMPGYARYMEKRGRIPAYEYTRLRRGQHLVDPLLAMYETIDFHVPNEHHVIAEYYPDDASRNYAALVLRDLDSAPFIADSPD